MPPLVATLLANGPSMLRMAGKLFGGDTEKISGDVADLLDVVQGKPAHEQQQVLEQHISKLNPADLVKLNQLKVRLEELSVEREKNQQTHGQVLHAETQKTARVEQQHGTDFVKETRPTIARRSFGAGTIYVLVSEASRLISQAFGGDIAGASLEIAAILYGPCVAYIGARMYEKGKNAINL